MKLVLSVTASLFMWIALPGCTSTAKKSLLERPNIIYIMSDDHAYQAISSYDGSLNQTPNIDRLAIEGARFANSFVTNSICAPSRATFLTGKHSHLNGMINNRATFDGTQLTFPKLLQEHGYQTAMIGKWHLKSDPTGFDYWNILPGQGHYYNPAFITNGRDTIYQGYVTNLITDMGIEWMEDRDPSKPFCLLVHHKAPHRNWMPDSLHFDLYDAADFPVPDNFFDSYENRQAAAEQKMHIFNDMDMIYDLKMLDDSLALQTRYRSNYEGIIGRLNPDERAAWDREYDPIIREYLQQNQEGEELAIWKFRRYMTDYLRCIASVDDNVGRLLDYLDRTGLADNTIVIYTSDQGFYLGEHGWFDKRFMYEESFRTPLLVRDPFAASRGVVIDEMVQNIDYAPTLLEYAGIDIPDEMQGLSLKGLIEKGEAKSWRESLYYHYYEYPAGHSVKRHYGVRTATHKLIHFYDDINRWELYNLEEDPTEMNNLFGTEQNSRVQEELMDELSSLRIQYQDTASLNLAASTKPVPRHSVMQHDDYYVWGASMTQTSDGTCHLYYSRWKKELGFKGWLTDSEIAYATADNPGGPYSYRKTILTGRGPGHWDEKSAHNPHIRKFGENYYLYFVSNSTKDQGRGERENRRYSQRIGVAVSENPEGPWVVSPDPLIDYQQGKPAHGYMVNPSVCRKPDGNYLMMFKARPESSGSSKKFNAIQCLATAPSPSGPFTIADDPVLTESTAEDPYIWAQNGRYYAIVDDQFGEYLGFHGLALFESLDGYKWKVSEHQLVSKTELLWEDGKVSRLKHLERPQLWFNEQGNPAMLFCAMKLEDSELKGKEPALSMNVHIPLISN